MIGTTVLHYTILQELGRGGMGVVYKAQDTRLERPVALKFLPPHLHASDQDKARFLQEAKAAAALNHPNICSVIDVQEVEVPASGGARAEKQIFIVMEFIDGQTLQELVGSRTSGARDSGEAGSQGSTLPLKRAIDIGVQIAEGLAAAHEKGIIHRDIKPENIMIRKDGIVQIMDFGLAKLRGVSRLTKEGSTVGTAGYMSPEQVQGQDADHRSDIFSLGVVLYQLLSGQPPFRGVHETALIYEIVNVDPLPISSVRPEIDRGFDAVVLGCLEKDPDERTQSAKQVSIDLKRLRRDSNRTHASRIAPSQKVPGIPPGPVNNDSTPPQRARFLWPSVSGVLAIALLVTGWMLWNTNDVPRAVTRFGILLPKDQTLDIANDPAVAVSADGSRVVYRANGKLYQRRAESFACDFIPGTEDGSSPFFSPDGKWVGFFAGGQLKKIPVGGGAAVPIAEAPNPRGGTWGKDGTIVYCPMARGGLFRVREDGGDAREITRVDTLSGERTHRWPRWLLDGRTVIFTVGSMDSPDYYEEASIGAVDVQTGKRKLILKGASTARSLPQGYLVYSHVGTLFVIPFDPGRLETSGTSVPLISGVSSDVTTGASHYACSENGVLVYVPGSSTIENRLLALIDQGGSVRPLPAAAAAYVDPQMSPDGKRVAVAIQSGKNFDIWVYDVQRNTSTRLTFGGSNRSPIWSPDSRRLAYSANAGGSDNTSKRSRVVIIDADGSGAPKEFTLNFDRNYVNCWSRDGSTLIVTVPQEGMGWDLLAVPVSGDQGPWTVLSTKFDESFASLSPDGKWMAYICNETGTAQVYVRPFPHGEGKWQISTDAATRPEWSADGRTLYYSTQRTIMAVPVQGLRTLTAGQPRVFVRDYHGVSVESAVSFNVLADGKHVLVTTQKTGDEVSQQINVVVNWFDEIRSRVLSGR